MICKDILLITFLNKHKLILLHTIWRVGSVGCCLARVLVIHMVQGLCCICLLLFCGSLCIITYMLYGHICIAPTGVCKYAYQ